MGVIFGVGVVIGILAVVGLLRLTMNEEPTGCFILLAFLIFFACWGGLLTRWLLFG